MKKVSIFLLCLILTNLAYSQIIVDYRAWQSPVKNQENRGTAFAVIAAMETLPGMPVDLSEQHIFAMSKLYHYKEMPVYGHGLFLKFYTDMLGIFGTLREDQAPYQPNSEIWAAEESDFEKMKKDLGGSKIYDLLSFGDGFSYKIQPDMFVYREGAAAQDVAWIKQQLDNGIRCIPVSYPVNALYWSQHKGSQLKQIDPKDFVVIKEEGKTYSWAEAKKKHPKDKLFNLLKLNLLSAEYSDTIFSLDHGHAVAIVGYDANGFLIKNSWGTDTWGDKGYGWVGFDYHRLFAAEVLTLPLGKVAVNEWGEVKEESRDKAAFRLKSLPIERMNALSKKTERGISLSVVFYGKGKMPRFSEIEYKGYDENGKLLGVWYGSCSGIFDGRETGYETFVFGADRSVFPKIHKITAKMKSKSGWSFDNEYSKIEAKNQEYKSIN